MSASCLYGPETPGEITMGLAGRVPAGLVAAFGSEPSDGPTAGTSPATPGRWALPVQVCVYQFGDS